jgi:hypothetical protein
MEDVHSFHDWLEINKPTEETIPNKTEGTSDAVKVDKPIETTAPISTEPRSQRSTSNPKLGYYKYWDTLTSRVLKAKYKNETDSFDVYNRNMDYVHQITTNQNNSILQDGNDISSTPIGKLYIDIYAMARDNKYQT